MKKIYYWIYLLAIFMLTVFFSYKILEKENYFTTEFVLPPLSFEKAGKCPCERVGEEAPGCTWKFLNITPTPEGLRFTLVPNSRQIYDGVFVCISPTTIEINSQGFRDYEYSEKRAKDVYRIIAIVDSITFGLGVELNETYPKLLEKMLNENRNNKNVSYEVLNFGIPSLQLKDKIILLKKYALRYDPQIIIIQVEESDFLNEKRHEALRGWLKVTKPNLSELERDAEARYLAIREIERQNLKNIAGNLLAEMYDIPKNITIIFLMMHMIEKHRKELFSFVTQNGWIAIDLTPKYEGKLKREEIFILPGKEDHPPPFFHRLIAEEILFTLKDKGIA